MSKAVLVCLAVFVAVVAADHNCDVEGRVCQNGGICHDGSGGPGYTTPSCVCKHPYAGAFCDYTIRECSDSPCLNGGQCIPASCTPVATTSGYEAVQFDCFRCACKAGFTGSPFFTNGVSGPTSQWNSGGICDFPLPPNDCTTGNKCLNGGNCTNLGDSTTSSYNCACTIDYIGGDNQNCSIAKFNCDPNYPNAQACMNGATCPAPRTSCQCGAGSLYGGKQCDQLWCNTHTCLNGGTCTNGLGGTGGCTCPTGLWQGTLCEQPRFCAGLQNGGTSNPCQNGGSCNSIFDRCDCAPGFDGIYCNATTFCSSNPCKNGANCTNTIPSTVRGGEGTCYNCPNGFYGYNCELAVTGCALTGCANGGQCRCTNQANCLTYQYSDACVCGADSATATTVGTYSDCGCNTTVTKKCPPGSVTAPNQYPAQPTQLAPSNADRVCLNGATCTEFSGRTVCQCRAGFWGEKCENYDNPCLNKPCQNGGRCRFADPTEVADGLSIALSDRYWGYFCNCRYPYYGLNCENKWDPNAETGVICQNNKCLNGATCYKRAYGSEGGFHASVLGTSNMEVEPYGCTCIPGFGGPYCEIQIEVCDMLRGINPCQNGGFCRNALAPGGIVCQCKCGYAGYRCEISGGLSPTLKGIAPNFLDFCSDNQCKNGGVCLNTLNRQGLFCLCPPGWRGTFCEWKARSAAASVAPSMVIAALAAVIAVFAMKN